jgi:hypothetical protein
MNNMKFAIKLITINFFGLFLMITSPVQAGLMICSTGSNGSSATLSLSNAADAECFTGNDTNQIDSNFLMFGMTGWILSDKNDGPEGDGVIEFIDAPGNGTKSGDWEIDTLAGLDNIAITLKAGNGFGAFLLDLTVADPLSGIWASSKNLSHASIYYTGTPSKVPEPSIMALFALGLFGLGFVRRRKYN